MHMITPKRNTVVAGSGQPLTQLQKCIAECVIEDTTRTAKEIAEITGCDTSNVYKVLGKQHVRDYLTTHISNELMIASVEAMAVQRSLLHSKSDYVKHEVAKDVLNRAQVGSETGVQRQAVQVKIDLS